MSNNITRLFRCKTCGTNYTTEGKDVPPTPKWSDGHNCDLVEDFKNKNTI
jgi:hypothetical protein